MRHAHQPVFWSIGWNGLLAVPVVAGIATAGMAAVPRFDVTTPVAAEMPANEVATEVPPFLPGKDARRALARYMFPDGRVEPRLRCIREASCLMASRP